MRLIIKIKPNQLLIPFDHQHLLVGSIHKWLGWNKIHDNISLYSFSRLDGGKAINSGLKFEHGTSFFFSSHETGLIKSIIEGVQRDPFMFSGLFVSDIIIQENPDLTNRELFFLGSPILIKRQNGNKVEHIMYDNPHAGEYLKKTLLLKMQTKGMFDESFSVDFYLSYPKAGTKKINYNGIGNRVNWCPVFIRGSEETKLFAWNVGLGNSTGIGFGAIK